MMIHILPIEPFDERYTEQWFRWWPEELLKYGHDVNIVSGDEVGDLIDGEFLDPVSTWIWKGSQVANFAKAVESGDVVSGDIVMVMDGWGPAITAIGYMRDACENLDIKICGFFHAGSYDPWDFLARVGMDKWASGIESSWLEICDLVLLGSEYHKKLLVEKRRLKPEKAFVCGLPIYPEEYKILIEQHEYHSRKNLVVFPHRLAPEKAKWEFDLIKEIFEKKYGAIAEWVVARECCESKKEYYQLLANSKVVVSTARQETFGIAMQEGIAFGAWAVAPNRLSYPETIKSGINGMLYETLEEAADFIFDLLRYDQGSKFDDGYTEVIKRVAFELKRFG